MQIDGPRPKRVGVYVKCNFSFDRAKYYKGIADVLMKVYKHEGILGFYKGLFPRMLYVTPLIAIQYSGYQLIKKSLGMETY